MNVDAETRLFLLLGQPVDHSFSPLLHNTAFAELNLNCIYLAAPVKPEQIGQAVHGLRALNVAGANVTSPHKEAVIKYLDQVSDEARVINSVNTIVNQNGLLYGASTDGCGFFHALDEQVGREILQHPVVIFGAGGAARAIAYTLACRGAATIYLVNRRVSRAEELSHLLLRYSPLKQSLVRPLTGETLKEVFSAGKLFIYTLPLDFPEFSDLLLSEQADCSSSVLYDLRYNPPVTGIMHAFEQAGGRVFNGAAMLYWQAVEAFRLFTGEPAPLEVMASAFRSKVNF